MEIHLRVIDSTITDEGNVSSIIMQDSGILSSMEVSVSIRILEMQKDRIMDYYKSEKDRRKGKKFVNRFTLISK